MAPVRKGQRKSSSVTSFKLNNQTPMTSAKTPAMITQRQKQALMDNLQLEVTERARKLRAQYALQAQSLHTRIELRVNRIPTSLRKVTMGELLMAHSAPAKSEPPKVTASASLASKSPSKPAPSKTHRLVNAAAPAPRGVKRKSDAKEDDKENTPDLNQAVANPKKRTRAGEGRRVPNPATVLSPKSSNCRNVPQSSVRNQLGSPQKPTTSRPASPLKPASSIKPAATTTNTTTKAATAARTKAAPKTVAAAEVKSHTGRTKRGLAVAGDRAVSSASSNASGASAGTTIVKKVGRALGATGTTTAAAAKKAAGSAKTTRTAKKTASATAVKTSTATTTGTGKAGRKLLRKRA